MKVTKIFVVSLFLLNYVFIIDCRRFDKHKFRKNKYGPSRGRKSEQFKVKKHVHQNRRVSRILLTEVKPNILPEHCGYGRPRSRIIGGSEVRVSEFPWMALLSYKERNTVSFACGGTLVHESFVLTAAHCVLNKLVGVRLGEHDLETKTDCLGNYCASRPQDFNVSKKDCVVHSDYNALTKVNDIALIRLPRKAQLNTDVQPICLPVNAPVSVVNKEAIVAGWGQTDKGTTSSKLLKVNVPVLQNKKCNLYSHHYYLKESQMCAGGVEGKDSCGGDSGGPLMIGVKHRRQIKYVQYGIVSYGLQGCGEEETPAVYTNVVFYLKWIIKNLKL